MFNNACLTSNELSYKLVNHAIHTLSKIMTIHEHCPPPPNHHEKEFHSIEWNKSVFH